MTWDSRLRTLLLSLNYPNRVSYYDDWRDAFMGHPAFDCTELNILRLSPQRLARQLDQFDAIIALHSSNSDTLDFLRRLAPVLGQRKRARFISFVGNEYNSPYVSMPDRTRLLRDARCDLIATQLLQEAGEHLYADSGAKVVSVPHALNPAVFQPGLEHGARRRDFGVKGYRYPAFLGDDDRNRFLSCVADIARKGALTLDVSEDRRLGRGDWAAYLADCRGTLSTEAGSWYISPDDALMTRVVDYLRERRSGLVISNESTIRRAVRHLPMPLKSLLWSIAKHGPVRFEVIDDNNADFADVHEKIFRDVPRPKVYGKAISSRHFDAIGTKTCQVMQRGRFNDILQADVHYIAVEPDHSNIQEALRRFADASERQRIVDNVYEFAMCSHTYTHRAALVHKALTTP